MIPTPAFFDSLAGWILETSLQVALLAVFVLAIESVAWRRIAARTRLILWSLVLLRLVLPPLPAPSGASIVGETKLVEWLAPSTASEDAGFAAHPDENATETAAPTKPHAPIPFPKLAPVDPSAFEDSITVESVAARDASAARFESRANVVFVLCSTWAIGFLGVLAATLLRERRFRARLRVSRQGADPKLFLEVDSAARAIGLRRHVEVIVTDAVSGPATTGIRGARLLLPPDFAKTCDVAARRCVLLHELSHLRHRDALVDLGLVFLRAAFWFHPLVHLALHRFREAREEQRDHDALSVPEAPAPDSYARTLLAALERGAIDPTTPALAFLRGHEWRRRLTMIQNHGNPSRIVRVGSGLAVLMIGSGVLLGAATPTFVSPPAASAATSGGHDRIRVESYASWPAWRDELERTFQRVLPEVDLRAMSCRDALSSVSFLASLNVVLDPDLDPMFLESEVDLVARSITVRDALDRLLEPTDSLAFECFDGGIRIANRESVRPETETRFYSLAPFLDAVEASDHRDDVIAGLIELLRTYADPERAARFDEGSWSIGTYRDLLVLNADRAMHDSARRLLERLLGPIAETAKDTPPSRPYDEVVAKALATRVSLDVEDRPLREVLAELRERIGISIFVGDGWSEEVVRLNVQDVTVRDALEMLGKRVGLHPIVRSGVIVLSETPHATVELYEIGALVPTDGDERVMAIDSLHDVIRSQIDPHSWHGHPGFSISMFGDRMIVRQTPENQIALRGMLEALEKALRRD